MCYRRSGAGSLTAFTGGRDTAAITGLAAGRLGLRPGSVLRPHLGDGTPRLSPSPSAVAGWASAI